MSMIGKSLAHYNLAKEIGKGGMGVVYQAKDQKLGRDVAIKVLPEEFAKDTERVARFQREAKLLASLNHPNIAAIYGLEKSDDTHFLVMELIEGDTLADRIKSDAILVEESLKLALQIAEALEAAHEKGVIHRDLKPANIKVTSEGKVKVLDFGLAKAYAGDQSDLNLSNSPTLSDAATQAGVILGTAAYMSPEQARGKPVDKRADIWAFGVVLYEMLTGKAAFSGRDVTDILAAVIRSEPDWTSLPTNLHWRLREVLERCLEKEVKDRCSGISDARVEIQKVLADPSGVFSQPVQPVKPQKKLKVGIPWVAAITIIGIIIAGVAVWLLKPSPPAEPKQVSRLEYELPEGQHFTSDAAGEIQYLLAVSPDGSQFAYCTTDGLFLRSMNELTARHIAGTDKDSQLPFFSPDGQWIVYWSASDYKLKKVGVSGGTPMPVCDTGPTVMGVQWGLDDTIVYSDILSGIMQVSSNGGTPETLVKASLGDITNNGFPILPQILPDGDTLLSTNLHGSNPANNDIVVQSLQSGDRKILFTGAQAAIYLPTGHIVYASAINGINNLFAFPFDFESWEIIGSHVSVLEGIRGGGSFSDSGTLVYVPQLAGSSGTEDASSPARRLVWVDMEGNEEPLEAKPENYMWFRISPDGNKVALTVTVEGNSDIYILDIAHGIRDRLTFNEAQDNCPAWTPDGKHIIFRSTRNGLLGGLYWKSADVVGDSELLGSEPNRSIAPWSLSKDGKFLVTNIVSITPIGFDIGMMSMGGNREMNDLLQEKYDEAEPQISPGGRYIAYRSNELGTANIYVRTFPNVNERRWPVSSNGGISPLWSPDGTKLYYRNGDATMVMEVETEPEFKRGNSKTLFRGDYFTTFTIKNNTLTPWDIHPDGDKFLMIKSSVSTADESTTEEQAAVVKQPKFIIITNWFEEVRERAPVD